MQCGVHCMLSQVTVGWLLKQVLPSSTTVGAAGQAQPVLARVEDQQSGSG
jgi:hypothetical protein